MCTHILLCICLNNVSEKILDQRDGAVFPGMVTARDSSSQVLSGQQEHVVGSNPTYCIIVIGGLHEYK